jgi:hypothetical protein
MTTRRIEATRARSAEEQESSMPSLARCASLGFSLFVLGCGATNEGAAAAPVTSAPAPIASAPPTAPTAAPASACISPEARAAVETCAARPPRQPTGRKAAVMLRSAPAPLDPKRLAAGPAASDPCSRQAHLTEATLAKGVRKEVAMGEIRKQLDVHGAFLGTTRDPAQRFACTNRTAQLLTETAMTWHFEAVGAGGVRGTGDAKTMELAARLYELVLQTFKQEEFARFDFPRLAREDWPSLSKIRYALADLFYFTKDWTRCGPAFEAVAAEDPGSSQAPEAAYASALCYQNVYTQTHQAGQQKPSPKTRPSAPPELTEAQRGMLASFSRYLCYIQPAAGDKAARDSYVEVAYARARTYFEAERWDEAAVAFRNVAMNHADTEVGVYAAQLYLEALNMLGSSVEPPRPACYTDMAADVPRFVELYCKGDGAKKNAEVCGILTRIQSDIERLRASGR